jgi:rhodanese-related sulfurtransferase
MSNDEGGPLADLLRRASESIDRLAPGEAHEEACAGALIVDIRSELSRERDGIVPGSLHIPRTVLEWRVARDSAWRNPAIGGSSERLILLCDHGCSSLLAAATLAELGFSRATDVIGGFEAWRREGLPVTGAPPPTPPGELPGTRGPDV